MPPKTPTVVGDVSTDSSSVFSNTGPATKASISAAPLQSDFGILVATRIRPFNKKELAEHVAQMKLEGKDPTEPPLPVIDIESDGKSLVLLDPKDLVSKASFTFDHIFSAFAPTVELNCIKRRSSSLHAAGSETPGTSKDDDASHHSNQSINNVSATKSDSDDDEESEEVLAERAQSDVYRALGAPIVRSAWEGYNACIFAYGQTSSGKTYTMMGTKRDPGVIPRLCKDLFEKIEDDENRQQLQQGGGGGGGSIMSPDIISPKSSMAPLPQVINRRMVKVTVSYMEIYNEQVRDLLKPRVKGAKPKFNVGSGDISDEYQSLKVRQHPLHGPFVEGLTTVDVDNWLECVKIIRQGNEVRSHCTTEMNESSSRSHAIFQMILTQTEALGARVRGKDVTNHKVSKINLVDLAGSERIVRTNVSGKHLTEAQSINQSLSTLRRVIDSLVQKKKGGAVNATMVIPYRDSMLTWILSDNFGGNSKTVMCANVSPHCSNASETESTLRYATLARGIVNRIRVNEDPSAKLIRELQNQLKVLQEEMAHTPQQGRVEELIEEINENKRAMDELATKEEGMKRLISESRAREEKLLSDVENHQKGEEKWRKEAEKLRKEKDELRRALSNIAKSNPELVAKSKEQNFWMLDLDDDSVDAVKDDEQACPQPMSRKKSSMRYKRGSVTASYSMASPVSHSPRRQGKNSLWDDGDKSTGDAAASPPFLQAATVSTRKGSKIPDAPATTVKEKEPSPVRSPPPNPPISPSTDQPRFGRRAATEELKERPKEDSREGIKTADERPRSEQVLQGLNARVPGQTSIGSVPLSLQHLAGLTTLVTPAIFGGSFGAQPLSSPSPSSSSAVSQTKPSIAPAKAKNAPDALDTFLEGGGPQEPKARRGVPPWRKQPAK